MRNLLLFLLLSMSLYSGLAYSQNTESTLLEETAIKQLIAEFLVVRERNDEQALLALLTEDIDQLTSSGNLRSGRDRVSNGSLASTRNNSGTRTITVESIRFIKADVAIVNGLYDIVDRADGPDRHYLTSFVVVMEDERWKISAIRNMNPTQ
ncbi:MAG: SgcJ/EcaC family oxidoreductase [Woeseia sp.]|jgi:uncharacterized protein (TIGR02246 family)|nr:SgcJ/EcaC family oxidoreductase [Woeseia sp.]MDG2089705.1 SgcJ/EcaC family oxidoreductase [Gammaproteobacteria bacterium]